MRDRVFSLKSGKENTLFSSKFSAKAQQLKQFLKDEAKQIGREVSVVQRRSKLTGAHLVQNLVLGWLANPQASLNGLVQVGCDLGVNISMPALQQWITERAVALKRFREPTRLTQAVLKHFSVVNTVDSSLIHLPDKLQTHFRGSRKRISPAQMKVQLSFDYRSGNLNAIGLQSCSSPDQCCKLPVAWALLMTNAPPDWLSLRQLTVVYRIHWQVELVFKLWKSQAALGGWSLRFGAGSLSILCSFARFDPLSLEYRSFSLHSGWRNQSAQSLCNLATLCAAFYP